MPRALVSCLGLCGLLALAPLPSAAEEALILPSQSLLRGQQFLRQAEQEGAATLQPGALLALHEKINAAWSAYHRQVEEEADDPDDDEAVVARQLAEQVEVDAELLRVSLRTQHDEARLDGVRASLNLPAPKRLEVPPPDEPVKGKP